MGLKLQLVKDSKIIFEIPLTVEEWKMDKRRRLKRELEVVEREIEEFVRMFDAFSNENRIRMIAEIAKDPDYRMKFRDIKGQTKLNPKIVTEGLKKMMYAGLLDKEEKEYRIPPIGFGVFLASCVALRKIMDALEWEYGEEF